jgi:hypothetical protein
LDLTPSPTHAAPAPGAGRPCRMCSHMHVVEVLAVLRRILLLVVPLLLALPAYTSLPATRLNLNRVDRLRTAGRVAPDTGQDREYQALLP